MSTLIGNSKLILDQLEALRLQNKLSVSSFSTIVKTLESEPCGEDLTEYYVEALYDFSSAELGDLSFKKGDILALVKSDHQPWCQGRVIGTNQFGEVPTNYVTPITGANSATAAATLDDDLLATIDSSKLLAEPMKWDNVAASNCAPPNYQQNQPSSQPMQYAYGQGSYPNNNLNGSTNNNNYAVGSPVPVGPFAHEIQQQNQDPSGSEPQGERNKVGRQLGQRFGEAAVFGAGAAVGASIINNIF